VLPGGLGHYGQFNRYWLEAFALDRRRIKNWVPIPKLIADDDLFDKEQTRNIAYAESWTTVIMLLSTKDRLPRFRRYLETIRLRRAPGERLKDVRDTLGDLDELDSEVKHYAETMIRKAIDAQPLELDGYVDHLELGQARRSFVTS
jgi:hypothetical protein